MKDQPTIRDARESDLEACRVIEDDAGAIFAEVGMDVIDDDAPRSLADLHDARCRGDLWMACDGNDVPVAFALTCTVDGNLHLEEIGVLRAWQRQGIGALLLEHLAWIASGRGMAAMTLTTFRDVPWNAPYYRRLGFNDLSEDAWGPEMTAKVAEEVAHGLARDERAVMRRLL